MKLIIFILIVLIIAALLIRIILRSVNQHSPLLMQLHAAGIRTGDAERILSSGECWQRQKTLLTEREVSFMKGLLRIVDMKRWYLCPQVRVADIVQLNGNIRPRSRQWWQLFRMVSQWHVDVVIVERRSFSIVAAVELDDASHLRPPGYSSGRGSEAGWYSVAQKPRCQKTDADDRRMAEYNRG